MTHRIDGMTLAGLDIAADGSFFSLQGTDRAGSNWSLSLPTGCLHKLILTLPNIANMALRQLHGDDSLRIVYPAHAITVELASDERTFIVTLRAADGFHVSFGLSGEQCETIGDSPRIATLVAPATSRPS